MSVKIDLLERFRRALFRSDGLARGVRNASEADYLVNAEESGYTPEAIRSVRETVFKTAAGTALLDSLYFPE